MNPRALTLIGHEMVGFLEQSLRQSNIAIIPNPVLPLLPLVLLLKTNLIPGEKNDTLDIPKQKGRQTEILCVYCTRKN